MPPSSPVHCLHGQQIASPFTSVALPAPTARLSGRRQHSPASVDRRQLELVGFVDDQPQPAGRIPNGHRIPRSRAIRVLFAIRSLVDGGGKPAGSDAFAGATGAGLRCQQRQVHGHLSALRPVVGHSDGGVDIGLCVLLQVHCSPYGRRRANVSG